ncbi:metallophosphoesterase [Seonamhaeicola marinus]|uniref:Phosphoesterase n=1 Tax=Seonamhaeicola marinus TaxID=1912246 RepID=A0A5D0HUQ2_9FLAO|nr:metallophosphoesterase [Seonamhaeicola marinus]TYA74199.1 phosphoesterase [Seonamhaeicola marinus]
MKRRKFLKKGLWGLLGTSILTGLYTWQIEPFWLEFVKRKMPITNLPDHLVGKTLMQISDMHVGNRFDYNFIIESFQKAQEFNPDYVVYTGDFINYEDNIQYGQLNEVLQHAVKGNIATVGVLGNHDYGKDWSEKHVAAQITEQLEDNGISILKNTQETFDGLNIIGFDDYWSPNFSPEDVMVYYDASIANILLCHNPDVCDLDVWNGYQGWILSGHTHGGQCKPPFLRAPILPIRNKNYAQGEVDLKDGRMLYVNRALGHLFQVRFNVRPEITVFELQKA